MNLNNIIFIDNLATLDFHGLDYDTSRILINDFILDNYKMKNEFIVIIHGIGKDIIRKCTHAVLSKNKYVSEYKLFWNNAGCTVVKIKI